MNEFENKNVLVIALTAISMFAQQFCYGVADFFS